MEKEARIGMMITPSGVKGVNVFGKTLDQRKESLALLDLLEPDLIQVQELLNQRIKLLTKKVKG